MDLGDGFRIERWICAWGQYIDTLCAVPNCNLHVIRAVWICKSRSGEHAKRCCKLKEKTSEISSTLVSPTGGSNFMDQIFPHCWRVRGNPRRIIYSDIVKLFTMFYLPLTGTLLPRESLPLSTLVQRISSFGDYFGGDRAIVCGIICGLWVQSKNFGSGLHANATSSI